MGTKNEVGETSTNRRAKQRRLKHLWWVVPVILLVLIPAGLYLNEVRRCTIFHPTGDALFDRYAQAVISRQGWRLFTCHSEQDINPATLPDELLATWEPEFGDDPRYWQLRFFCARFRNNLHAQGIKPRDPWELSTPDHPHPVKHLETARERGVADAETLLLLHIIATSTWYDEVADQHGAPERMLDEHFDLAVAINADYEARLLALLDEAIAVGPDECWPYWERAQLRLSWGEDEAALADLRAGNACSSNVIPVCFPISAVLRDHDRHAEHGNQVLNGAILELAFNADYLGMQKILRWKSHAKGQIMRMSLGYGNAGLSDALHHTFCKMAVADGNHGMHQFGMAVYVWILAKANLELRAGSLGLEEVEVLNELIEGYNYIRRKEEVRTTANYLAYPALVCALEHMNYHGQGRSPALMHCLEDHRTHGDAPQFNTSLQRIDACSMQRYPSRFYHRLGEFWLSRSGTNRYIWEFERMAEVDYTSLERPEWWGPHPQFME